MSDNQAVAVVMRPIGLFGNLAQLLGENGAMGAAIAGLLLFGSHGGFEWGGAAIGSVSGGEFILRPMGGRGRCFIHTPAGAVNRRPWLFMASLK